MSGEWCRIERMFDIVGAGRASRVLGDPGAPGIDRLRAAARLRVLAEAAEAEAIHDLAVEQGWDREGTGFTYEPGGPGDRRWIRVGADGTPLVDEALPLEVATARGTSVGAAISLVKDVVDLSQRLPVTWTAVCQGRAPLWQAQRVAQACGDLPKDRAGVVDAVVAPLIGHLGYARLMTRVRAAVVKAAPRLARKKADEAAQSRYCVKRESSGDTGTCFIEACVDTADAVFLDATVDRLAEILGDRGDPRDKDHRRACALGLLATPAVALSLLGPHTRRGLEDSVVIPVIPAEVAATALPTCQVYVHCTPESLARGGVARVEDLGPVLVDQVARVVGHSRIKLTPVLTVGGVEPVVDAYEIPDRIRETVVLRDGFDVFPYSSRSARRQDLDHTRAYRPGRRGQTRPSNLGPVNRRAHRAKTLAGWHLDQPRPGVFWWRSELGQRFRVGPDGTTPQSNSIESELWYYLDQHPPNTG